MKLEYTENNNVTRHLNPPYLVSNVDELKLLANSMEKDSASYTKPSSSIDIANRTVLMQCVGPLLIYPF